MILNYAGGKTITVVAFDDLVYTTKALVDDGTGTPYVVRWERSGPGLYPFRAVLQGTYVNQYGDTWIFNSNGTGSTPAQEGIHSHGPLTPEFQRFSFPPDMWVGCMNAQARALPCPPR